MGCCGSVVSFWGSCWLEESLKKSSAGCALLSSLTQRSCLGDCLALGAEEDGGEPQTQPHTLQEVLDPVPLVQLDIGTVGGCFSSAEQLGKSWISQ